MALIKLISKGSGSYKLRFDPNEVLVEIRALIKDPDLKAWVASILLDSLHESIPGFQDLEDLAFTYRVEHTKTDQELIEALKIVGLEDAEYRVRRGERTASNRKSYYQKAKAKAKARSSYEDSLWGRKESKHNNRGRRT